MWARNPAHHHVFVIKLSSWQGRTNIWLPQRRKLNMIGRLVFLPGQLDCPEAVNGGRFFMFSFCASSTGSIEMRTSIINSTIANASARLVNAVETMRALFATQLRRLDFSWAGVPAVSTSILRGNPGAAKQVQLLMPGRVSSVEEKFGKDHVSFYLPSNSDRNWLTPGLTRRQTRWAQS